jgi:hypothetical protein
VKEITTAKREPDITKSTVTFALSTKLFTGIKVINSVADELAKKHKGDAEALRGQAAALTRGDRLSVQRIALEARKFLRDYSVTWDDKGTRLVSAKNFQLVNDKLTSYQQQFTKAVKTLAKKFGELQKTAKQRVGDLFVEIDFPVSPDDFASRYLFEYKVDVLSEQDSQFIKLVGLNRVSEQEFKLKRDAQRDGQVKQVQQEVVDRINAEVKKIAEVLGKTDAIFRDSLIGNLRNLAEIAPSLNVARNPEIDKLIEQAAKLGQAATPEQVRKDDKVRARVAKEADEFSKKLAGVKI